MINIPDSRQKYYMKEIATLIKNKTSEVLGESTSARKTIGLNELKKMIDGARSDEVRLTRSLERMVKDGSLEKKGFGWMTTETSEKYFRELLSSE